MKALLLTLQSWPFQTMHLGYKDREYRKDSSSNWIRSRLIDSKTDEPKHYDVVKFVNGYGKDKPYFVAAYKGFEMAKKNYMVEYKTGLKVNVKKGDFRILLGPIIRKGNVYSNELF